MRMYDHLVRALQRRFDETAIRAMAEALGLEEAEIEAALIYAVPALVAGIGEEVGEAGGAEELLAMVDAADIELLHRIPIKLREERAALLDRGATELRAIFDAREQDVIDALAHHAKISRETAGAILRVLTPITLSKLAFRYRDRDLTVEEFAKAVKGEGKIALVLLPMNFARTVDQARRLRNIGRVDRGNRDQVTREERGERTMANERKERMKGMIPLAIGVVVVAGLLFFLKPPKREDPAMLGQPDGERAGLLDEAGRRIRQNAREVEQGAEEMSDRVAESVESGAERARDNAELATERADREVEELEDRTDRLADDADQAIDEQVERARQSVEEAEQSTSEAVRATEREARRGGERAREEGSRILDEASAGLHSSQMTIPYETSQLFEGNSTIFTSEAEDSIREIVTIFNEQDAQSITLRGAREDQLYEIAKKLEERGFRSAQLHIEQDNTLDQIEVVYEK